LAKKREKIDNEEPGSGGFVYGSECTRGVDTTKLFKKEEE